MPKRTRRARRRAASSASSLIKSSYARRLHAERLEDRRMLATLIVDNPVHDGVGGLREAIDMANAMPGPDEITFDATLSGETIALSGTQLQVTDTLTIDASALDAPVTIDAEGMSRVLRFSTAAGFETTGDLTLTNLVFTSGNTALADVPLGRGAGIAFMSDGALTLNNSAVTGNTTSGDDAVGGGIYSRAGNIMLVGSTVSFNRTNGARAGGGGIHVYDGDVTLDNSVVSGNITDGLNSQGGGIYAFTGDVTLLNNSAVSGNTTRQMGSRGGGVNAYSGNLSITESTVAGNRTYGAESAGGGVFSNAGLVVVSRSEVSHNNTMGAMSPGGGVSINSGSLVLFESTLSGNVTSGNFSYGGGIHSDMGGVLLNYSTASSNRTTGDYARGGGINSFLGGIVVSNATLSGNETSGLNADGGALFTSSGGIVLRQSTVTQNRVSGVAATGGGFTRLSPTPQNTSIEATLLAGNFATTSLVGPDFDAGAGAVTVESSLIGDNNGTGLAEAQTADASGNLIGQAVANGGAGIIDPLLGPLVNNGGLTETHALLEGSPAINAGVLTQSITDQRGAPFFRNDAAEDIGAYERQSLDASLLIVTTTADEFDFSNNEVSLREAIAAANGNPGADVITFSPLFNTDQVINLATQLPAITDSLSIAGPTTAELTIDAGDGRDGEFGTGDGFRIFTIDDGDDATFSEVTISNLILTGGDAADGVDAPADSINFFFGGNGENGGAILSRENLTVVDSLITGNKAGEGGNGSFFDVSDRGDIAAVGSYAPPYGLDGGQGRGGSGGAISSEIGNLTITRSVFTNNQHGFQGINGSTGNAGAIFSGAGDVTVTDSRFEQNGREFVGDGGAIFNGGGTLTVTGSAFINNVASDGGAIASLGDDAAIELSNFTGNRAVGSNNGDGGAILNFAELNISASTFRDNTAANNGGAIETSFATTTIRSSTFTGNSSGDDGGAIANRGVDGVLNVELSTISGNMSTDNGGGIDSRDGTVNISSSTITLNTAGGDGDGVRNRDGTLNITSTIIAQNDAGFMGSAVNVFGPIATNSFNLIGGDPMLAPLADNGGPTPTHALLPGSPALNIGSSSEDFDQRGAPFAREDEPGFAAGPDIGAYERQTVPGLSLRVDSTGDENDGDYSAGELTLREAIGLANGSIGGNIITFSSLFDTPQTILLNSQLPTISDSLTIFGPGEDLLTIDARAGADGQFNTLDGFRIFDINDGDDNNLIDVTISGLTLTGGDVAMDDSLFRPAGGAIRSRENLSVLHSTITNSAAGSGGGISDSIGTLTIIGSTITGNTGISNLGGGVSAPSLVLTDSTVSMNEGGGVLSIGPVAQVTRSVINGNTVGSGFSSLAAGAVITLTDSTVSGNQSDSNGGGISFFNFPFQGYSESQLTLLRSTISGNMAEGAGGGIIGNGDNGDGRYGIVTLIDSTVTDNQAAGLSFPRPTSGGGGGVNASRVELTRSTVSENRSLRDGGGIDATFVELDSSTVSGNMATGEDARGGGILGRVTAVNSTISGNEAAFGGGIESEGNVTINHTTIADNSARTGFGGLSVDNDSEVTLTNSIVALNRAPGADPNFFGVLTPESGFNLIDGDPRIGPLADNGGPTKTHALLNGSPAIDSGEEFVVPDSLTTLDSYDTDTFAAPNSPYNLNPLPGRSAPINPPQVVGGAVNLNVGATAAAYLWNRGERLASPGDTVSIDLSFNPNLPDNFNSAGLALFSELADGNLLAEVRVAADTAGVTLFRDGENTDSISGAPVGPMTITISVQEVTATSMTILSTLTASGIGAIEQTRTISGTEAFFGPVAFDVSGDETSHDNLRFAQGLETDLAADQRGLARSADGGQGGGVDIGAFEAQAPPPVLAGDYNRNGRVDAADYTVWRDSLGDATDFYAGADGNGDGVVDTGDYETWRNHFGDTIFPTTLIGPNTLNGEFSILTPNSGASQVDLSRGRVLANTGTPGTTVTIPGWEIERVNFQGGNGAFGFDGLSPLGSDGNGAPVDPVAFVNNDTVRLSTDSPIPFSFDTGDQVQLLYRVGSDNTVGTAEARLIFDRGLPTESTVAFDPIMISTAGLTFEDNQTVFAPGEATTVSLEFTLGELNPGGPGVQRTQLDSVRLTVFPALGMTQTVLSATPDRPTAATTTSQTAITSQPITASALEASLQRVKTTDAGFALLLTDPPPTSASKQSTTAAESEAAPATDDTLLLLALDKAVNDSADEVSDAAFAEEEDESKETASLESRDSVLASEAV